MAGCAAFSLTAQLQHLSLGGGKHLEWMHCGEAGKLEANFIYHMVDSVIIAQRVVVRQR